MSQFFLLGQMYTFLKNFKINNIMFCGLSSGP